MTFTQKLINLTTIIIISIFLSHFHDLINTISQDSSLILSISKKIMKAEALNEQDVLTIKEIVKLPQNQKQNDGLRCLLQAYNELVLEKQLQVSNLFHIFSQGRGQYNNVKLCSHFISLLLYEAQISSIQPKIKAIVLQYLNKQLKEEFSYKYFHSTQIDKKNHVSKQICVLNYARNGEATIKQEILSLIKQNYENTNVNIQVQVDGSKDNTQMFAKFTLQQNQKINSANIKITNDGKTQGFIKRMKSFNQKQCKQNSIVLILQKDQVLLSSQIFNLIDLVFQERQVKVGIFNTLTTNHTNIHSHSLLLSQKLVLQSSQLYPVIAIEKEALTTAINHLQARTNINEIYLSEFQFYIFLNDFLASNQLNDKQIIQIEQVVAYRVQRNRIEGLRLVEQLVKY